MANSMNKAWEEAMLARINRQISDPNDPSWAAIRAADRARQGMEREWETRYKAARKREAEAKQAEDRTTKELLKQGARAQAEEDAQLAEADMAAGYETLT